jgi:hypothetical protein
MGTTTAIAGAAHGVHEPLEGGRLTAPEPRLYAFTGRFG